MQLYFPWVDSRLFVPPNDKRGPEVGCPLHYKTIQKLYCSFKGNQEKVVIKSCNTSNSFVLEKSEKFFFINQKHAVTITNMTMIMSIRIMCTWRSKNMCCRLTLTCHSWKDCKRELSGLHTDMETRTYSRRHSGGNIMKVNNTGNLTTVEEVVNLLSASRIKKYLRYFANISIIHQNFLYKPSTVNLHKLWPESHYLI